MRQLIQLRHFAFCPLFIGYWPCMRLVQLSQLSQLSHANLILDNCRSSSTALALRARAFLVVTWLYFSPYRGQYVCRTVVPAISKSVITNHQSQIYLFYGNYATHQWRQPHGWRPQ